MPLHVFTNKELRQHFGDFAYREDPSQRGAIIIDPTWVSANIVTAHIPQLIGLPYYGSGGFDGNVLCHRYVRAALQAAFSDIEAQGEKDKLLFWTGSFVPRHKAWNPARDLSPHSWGVAVDLNDPWNHYGERPAPAGARGSVVTLIPIFERHGFAWGGYFSTPDGMHFEYALVPQSEPSGGTTRAE
jgi:hypothetical protein